MTKEQFVEVIKLHKQSTDNLNEYYKMGLDLLDNKNSPVEPLFKAIDILFDSIYTEEGVEWISWYIYDNNYGEQGLTAFDGEIQICKDIDELYDYIQKYKKVMKTNYTHIAILLDRSGSMSRIASDMEGGLKTFLNEQKLIPGDLTISLTQFDDEYTPIFVRRDVNNIEDIKIVPRGSTALIDSAVRMIKDVDENLKSLPEEEKPEKVLFLIITDGEENSSTNFKLSDLKELIAKQETEQNWTFVYIGANQDAFLNASSYGISTDFALNYEANTAGVNTMYSSVSEATTSFRTTTSRFKFTNTDESKE